MPGPRLPDFDVGPADLVATAQLLLTRKPHLERLVNRKRCEVPGLRDHGFTTFDDAARALSRINSIAGTLLKQALEIKQDEPVALELLAGLYRERGEHAAALACDQAAMACRTDNGDSRISAIKSLLALGRFDDALEAAAAATGIARDRLECIRLLDFPDWAKHVSGRKRELSGAEPFRHPLTCVMDEKTFVVDHVVEQTPLSVVRVGDLAVIDGYVPVKDGACYVWDYGVADILASRSEAAWDNAFIHAANADTLAVEEPCIFPGGVGWLYQNYYHALAQYLPRLALLLDTPEYARMKIAVSAAIRPWGLELLEAMGVGPDRVVLLRDRQTALLRDATVPVIRPAVSRDEMLSLRRRLGGDPRKRGTRKIFLGRRAIHAHGRLLINEAEIAAIAVAHGYEEIDPGGMSIRQQIELFGAAAAICGPGGGAFGNIVYAPRDAAVICLSPRESIGTWYPDVAGLCGQPFYWCFGSFLPEGRISRSVPAMPFVIDPADFTRILELADAGSRAPAAG
jgi:hypothetical protein